MIEDKLVIDDYYLGRLKVLDIVGKHSLSVTQSIFKKFPEYVHASIKCEYCVNPLISDYAHRDESVGELSISPEIKAVTPKKITKVNFNSPYRRISYENKCIKSEEGYLITIPYCKTCKHIPVKTCTCNSCYELRSENHKKIAASLREAFKNEDDSTLRLGEVDMQLLFDLQMIMSSEDYTENVGFRLSGKSKKRKKGMTGIGLIEVDKSSVIDAVLMENAVEYSVNLDNLAYQVNQELFETDSPVLELKKVFQKKMFSASNHPDVLELWSEVAMDEALGVLEHYCGRFGMICTPGEKTLSIIQKSLGKYGLAQTARYVYNATKYAHTKGAEEGLDRTRTFNKIYGFM